MIVFFYLRTASPMFTWLLLGNNISFFAAFILSRIIQKFECHTAINEFSWSKISNRMVSKFVCFIALLTSWLQAKFNCLTRLHYLCSAKNLYFIILNSMYRYFQNSHTLSQKISMYIGMQCISIYMKVFK